MEKIKELNGRPKMKILESAYYEIINTIGSRPAESGGLLFGKEDDMIVQKFVFDKHAQITRSSYTFNTEFLNPEIKRIWNDKGLSCIGFIHSHPHGYGRLSPPDLEYFASMFECMPRKHYITPIVFTVPDGGFKINAHILPNKSKETISADVEILPDDYFKKKTAATINDSPASPHIFFVKGFKRRTKFDAIVRIIWAVWLLLTALSLSWFLFKTLYIFTNYFNKIMS